MTFADILPFFGFASGALCVYAYNHISKPRGVDVLRCQACGCVPDDGGTYSGLALWVANQHWPITVCRTCLIEASVSSMRLPLALERIAISAKTQREIAEQMHAKLLNASPSDNTSG